MSTINTGGPAFPPFHNPDTHASGMSIRDYFAAKALGALIAEPLLEGQHTTTYMINGRKIVGDGLCDNYATAAYKMADAMLKAREVQQ